MAITVEMPDGITLEFPDGTSQDVMRAAIQRKFGGPKLGGMQPPPGPRDPEFADVTSGASRDEPLSPEQLEQIKQQAQFEGDLAAVGPAMGILGGTAAMAALPTGLAALIPRAYGAYQGWKGGKKLGGTPGAVAGAALGAFKPAPVAAAEGFAEHGPVGAAFGYLAGGGGGAMGAGPPAAAAAEAAAAPEVAQIVLKLRQLGSMPGGQKVIQEYLSQQTPEVMAALKVALSEGAVRF